MRRCGNGTAPNRRSTPPCTGLLWLAAARSAESLAGKEIRILLVSGRVASCGLVGFLADPSTQDDGDLLPGSYTGERLLPCPRPLWFPPQAGDEQVQQGKVRSPRGVRGIRRHVLRHDADLLLLDACGGRLLILPASPQPPRDHHSIRGLPYDAALYLFHLPFSITVLPRPGKAEKVAAPGRLESSLHPRDRDLGSLL
jgi:hypothetical protein